MSEAVDRAKNQGIWLALGQIVTRGAQFASTIVLARLLVPESFGKVALAAVVWEVVALFGNTGVAATIIQRRDVEPQLLDAAFWLNVTVATAIAAVSLAVAFAASAFYREPAIVPVIALCAAGFCITSRGSIHAVLLTREVSFGRLALVDAIASGATALLSVAFALAGFGFYSLVLHAPIVAVLRVALCFRFHPWRPAARAAVHRWKGILGYGRYVLGAELAGYVCLNGDYMVTGKLLGQEALGVYSMAYRIANWPVEAGVWMVSRIAFPTLSALSGDSLRLAEVYAKMLRVVAILAFPAVAILFAAAPDLIAALYGAERWGGAAPHIRILLPYVLVRALGSPAAQVLLALGRARESFLFAASLTPVLIAAVAFGARSGVTGVAVATAAVLGMGAFLLTILSSRAARAPLAGIAAALVPGAVIGAAALAGSFLPHVVLPAGAAGARLAASLLAGVVTAWLALAVGFPEDRRLLLGTLGERSAGARWGQFRRGVAASVLGRGGGE
ncbi:MAG TPA: lipopolysaccharide biosynthesis protein [Verrucomicrobiae bacterium]|nr:lipopolysaccharide biosynthesis protein [Verrucomicrobiae bacterium]